MAGEFITAGTALKYGDSIVTDGVPAIPATWTTFPNVTGTPDFNATPDSVDATDLLDLVYKRNKNGLIDLGTREFEANYSAALIAAATAARTAPGTGKTRAWCVEIPAIKTRIWWVGELAPVMPAAAAVGELQTTTLSISLENEPAVVTYV